MTACVKKQEHSVLYLHYSIIFPKVHIVWHKEEALCWQLALEQHSLMTEASYTPTSLKFNWQ